MKIQYLWTGTASGISILFGGMPIAQSVELLQPYTPPDLEFPGVPLPEAVTSDPVTSDPVTDHSVTDHSATSDPVTDHSVTSNPVTNHSVTDHPVTDHPVTDHPEAPSSLIPDLGLGNREVNPEPSSVAPPKSPQSSKTLGLSFDLPSPVDLSSLPHSALSAKVSQAEATEKLLLPPEWWTMGTQSPIAIAIGMAEGTRTLDGGKTPAYYWHEDPGNGANNFGTFSYQHLPREKTLEVDRQASGTAKREVAEEQQLPELSDRLQLQRLKQFNQQLQHQAKAKGIELSLLELLNGLDLANQSEAAALSPWGYVDRLVQMRKLLPGQVEEQIKEARVWSYWSPDSHAWDAPGLGNNYNSIRKDQERRFAAVQQVLLR